MNCTRGKLVGAFLELSGLHVPLDRGSRRLLVALGLAVDRHPNRKEPGKGSAHILLIYVIKFGFIKNIVAQTG